MSGERKTLFETTPEWYTTNRKLSTSARLFGFKDVEAFVSWINIEGNILDLGAGEGKLVYELSKEIDIGNDKSRIYGYDKYFEMKKPFGIDDRSYNFQKVKKNWIKDDILNLNQHFLPNYFQRITSGCAFGMYAKSLEEFEKQFLAVKGVLANDGLFRFQLRPARGKLIGNRIEKVLDPSFYNSESDFLFETPYERFQYFPVKALDIVSKLGFNYSLHNSFDEGSGYGATGVYITCEVTKK